MNKYDELLEWIESGASSFVVAMLAIMYYIIQAEGMSAANLTDIMTRLNMTYDTTTHVLTCGETTCTIYDLVLKVINEYYENSIVVTPELITLLIYKTKRYGYITSAQATELKAALANA